MLLFYGSVAGAFALLVSAIFCTALISVLTWIAPKWDCAYDFLKICHWIDSYWHKIAPFEHSGKTVLAGVMAGLAWWPLNKFFDDDDEIDRIIADRNDPMELFLRTSMGDAKLVMLTVSSGKIYIGWITSNINPAFTVKSIRIIPFLSGYRDDKTKKVRFTTLYYEMYSKMEEEIRAELSDAQGESLSEDALNEAVGRELDKRRDDFQIAFPMDDIKSIGTFEMEVFNKYFKDDDVQEADNDKPLALRIQIVDKKHSPYRKL